MYSKSGNYIMTCYQITELESAFRKEFSKEKMEPWAVKVAPLLRTTFSSCVNFFGFYPMATKLWGELLISFSNNMK